MNQSIDLQATGRNILQEKCLSTTASRDFNQHKTISNRHQRNAQLIASVNGTPTGPRADLLSTTQSDFKSARSIQVSNVLQKTGSVDAKRNQNNKETYMGFKVSLQDMVDASDRFNTKEGITGYFLPKVITNLDKPICNSLSKDKMDRDFISTVIQKSKKTPSPQAYEPSQQFKTDPKEVKFYFAKDNRRTLFESEANRRQFVPAPNVYSPEKKQKPKGTIKFDAARTNLFDDAQFQGSTVPDAYNSTDFRFYKTRSPKSHWSLSKKKRFEKREMNDDPSPVKYEVSASFNKVKSPRGNVIIGKDKTKNFCDRSIQASKKVPPVGSYDLARADKFLTRGFAKSYK